MTPDLARAVPQLLACVPGGGDSPKELANRAIEACERFVQHLSRLLGETAVDMLFARSVVLASHEHPWLRVPDQGLAAQGRAALREALEQQQPAAIVSAFAAMLSALVGLLERLIGQGLVVQLLQEVWPTVFVPEAKDVP